MSLKKHLKEGISNPKLAIVYLIFGKKRYYQFKEGQHSCFKIKDPASILESHMIMPTNIHEHVTTLYMLTIENNLKNILELGTLYGESTLVLLEAAKKIGGRVTSVDIDPCLEAKRLIKSNHLENFWTFIQKDDLGLEWNEPIDHLFIDTSHTFDHTVAELEKFEPLVRKGGVITMHDIILYPEVMSAINYYLKKRKELRLYKYFNNNGLAILKK